MARKPRSEKAEAPKAPQTSPAKLRKLMATARAAYKDSRSIAGELGAEIKDASEHDHLHKKAFASCRAADRMEPEALADYFEARDYYEEVFGLRKRAASAPRLSLEDGTGEGDNVEQFPQAAE